MRLHRIAFRCRTIRSVLALDLENTDPEQVVSAAVVPPETANPAALLRRKRVLTQLASAAHRLAAVSGAHMDYRHARFLSMEPLSHCDMHNVSALVFRNAITANAVILSLVLSQRKEESMSNERMNQQNQGGQQGGGSQQGGQQNQTNKPGQGGQQGGGSQQGGQRQGGQQDR